MNLDVGKWKPFRIGDYFDIFTGGDLILRDIDDGKIPVCSHSAENNGVGAYVCFIPGRKLFNCKRSICLADRGTFHATVQAENYYIGTRVKALVLKESLDVDVTSLLFIATIINAESYRYSYGRNCTNRTEDIIVNLPTTPNSTPDWVFMSNYIKSLRHRSISTANNILLATISIKTESWTEFRLGDLFSAIYKAEAHVKADCECFDFARENTIPFISRTESRNACDCYVAKSGLTGIEKGQAIVIGDTTATCSYQANPFVCGDHIVICRADWINTYTALFIVTLIKREQYKYSYGRAFKMQLISETKIKLPTKDRKPDWEYMENYIKSLPYGDRI